MGHEYLTEKVTQTTYDNGYSVFVNYGYTDFVFINRRAYEPFEHSAGTKYFRHRTAYTP